MFFTFYKDSVVLPNTTFRVSQHKHTVKMCVQKEKSKNMLQLLCTLILAERETWLWFVAFQTGHDSSVLEELRTQLAQKERELQMMKAGAEELSSLRQQNYLLQSKVHKHVTTFIPYIWKICRMAHSYLGTARVRLFSLNSWEVQKKPVRRRGGWRLQMLLQMKSSSRLIKK